MTFVFIFLTFTSLHIAESIPILNNNEIKVNSIVISEINLPTEVPLSILPEQEPASSFLDLVEKYEGMYGRENDDEFSPQKRSFTDDDVKSNADSGGRSLIDKIEIPDPEVRKEFENELTQNQYIHDEDDTTENSSVIGMEYNPNYERKLLNPEQDTEESTTEIDQNESTTVMTVHDKENLQAHLVEQLIHLGENQHEFTTIVPDDSFTNHTLAKNPEIIEVLEHIVYESDSELKSHEHTITVNPIHVEHMDVDPIEIIPKDRHRETKSETENNDKFTGFVGISNENLMQPGEETTESDKFFIKTTDNPDNDDDDDNAIEAVRETLEFVAIYGKSMKIDQVTTEIVDITTQIPQIEEYKTEITEINTEISVSVYVDSEKSSSSEESNQQSLPNKSSEEEDDSKENEKKKIDDNSGSSEEIEAENVAKEDLSDEKLSLRSLEFPVTQRPNALPEEIFKDTSVHEIKKKAHPDGLSMPYDVAPRQLNDESQDSVVVAVDAITKVYEAFEEVVTEVSDGIKLAKELRQHIESFRGDTEENKIVLDTHSEAISSKNSKNPLVGVSDLEMMKLKERSFEDEPRLSIAIIPVVGVVSVAVLITLYKFIKIKATSIRLY